MHRTIRSATATLFIAGAMFLTSCVEPTTVVISEPVEEDRANAFRTMLTARGIASTLRPVDDFHYYVVVDTKDGTNEYVAQYEIDAAVAAGKVPERPSRLGAPLPITPALRERARALEEELRAMRGVLTTSAVLMQTTSSTAPVNDLATARPAWAHVGLVYEAIDERGTTPFRFTDLEKLVQARTGLAERDVAMQVLRRRPLIRSSDGDDGEQPHKLD